MNNSKIKAGDLVFFAGEFFTVEWIDDSGVSNLIGLRGLDGLVKVENFSERIILKAEEET
jgi:hypothetical protein